MYPLCHECPNDERCKDCPNWKEINNSFLEQIKEKESNNAE